MERRHFTKSLVAVLGSMAVGGAIADVVVSMGKKGSGKSEKISVKDVNTSKKYASGNVLESDGFLLSEQVIDENSKKGSLGWLLRGRQNSYSPGIEGFVDKVSLMQGEVLTLYVNTSAPSYYAEIYRMGYYQGLGARLIHRTPRLQSSGQPASTFTPGINMVECHWNPSRQFAIDDGYFPGYYLIKLVSSQGAERYVPFMVRDDSSKSAIVVQSSVTTWQAYNLWGGYSLYGGLPTGALEYRSRIVSFDRPYGPNLDSGGSGDFMGNEFPFVYLAERLGLDVTYWTDVDFHIRPELLLNHKVMVSLGHDEYWSMPMRLGAESALAKGVNLMFLGANACYRQIRLEPSHLGPFRHQVCYKDAAADPEMRINPALATGVSWATDPVPWYESKMIGIMYQAFQPDGSSPAPMVVKDASSWVFQKTGLRNNSTIPGVVGSEFDAYEPSEAPKNVNILAHSPINSVIGPLHSDMSYYTLPGAGGVFATGTAQWVSLLWDGSKKLEDGLHFGIRPAMTALTGITKNVLRVFASGPADKVHPSKANWRNFYLPGGPAITGVDV